MTVLAVAHDPYWHGWTDDAGHRPDSAMVVTWLAPNRAALDELSRARIVLRPPLPDDRAHDRALHRPAHPRPGAWRPSYYPVCALIRLRGQRDAVRGSERRAALRRHEHIFRRPGGGEPAGATRLFSRSSPRLRA